MDDAMKPGISRLWAGRTGKVGIGILLILAGPILTARATPADPLSAWRVSPEDQPTTAMFYGQSIAALGDLDGDGVPDLAVSSQFASPQASGQGLGAVSILFMNADGSVRQRSELHPPIGEIWGLSMAPLGDLNRDGTPDLALGIPIPQTYDPSFHGSVAILFLDPSGAVRERKTIDNPSVTSPTLTGFGLYLSRAGDLDGDGVVDLAATGWKPEGAHGGLWLLQLNRDGTLKDYTYLSGDSEPFASLLPAPNYTFGASGAALGDLNGDGDPELAIGCIYQMTAAQPTVYDSGPGKVLIASIHNLDTVTTVTAIPDPDYAPPQIFPYQDYDVFGCAVASVGDLDHNGVTDLAVGNFQPEKLRLPPSINAGGVVYVFLLNPDGTVKAQRRINRDSGPLQGQLLPDDNFGFALAMTGNLDNDGNPELAVTAPQDDTYAMNAGAVWMITLQGPLYPTGADLLGLLLGTFHPDLDPGLLSTYDVNHDGKVDISDFILLDLLGKAGN